MPGDLIRIAPANGNGRTLDQKVTKHEKIRFRRHEISALGTFPSAAGQDHFNQRGRMTRWALRGAATAATLLTSIAIIVAGCAYLLATTGISSERLRDEAETAITGFSGMDVDAVLGPARISIDRSQFLAVEVPDITLKAKGDGAPILEAKTIDFGIRPLPLLSGSIQLGSAHISDARVFAAAFGSGGGSDWTASLKNTDGLIDPDRISEAVFEAAHRLFEAFDVGSTRSIELDNVEIMLADDAGIDGLRLDHALLSQADDGVMQFSADLVIDGRTVTIEGNASRDAASKRIVDLKLGTTVSASATADGTPPVTGVAAVDPAAVDMLGPFAINLSGSEGDGVQPPKLSLSAALGRSTFAIDRANYLEGEVDLMASITAGENKARIENLTIRQGRSNYVLYGPVGPRPVTSGEPPAYRIELASDNSMSAPDGSTEPALAFAARLAATFDPAAMHLSLSSLGIKTGSGELLAEAQVDFVPGKPPGVTLAASVPEMSLSHIKQLWPFTAAGGGRRWAMKNLFGGTITNAKVQFRVPPGRIGNGVPLSADEVFGHVDIAGTRFDITGRIPPMRDAAGSIDFRGNDIDVALHSSATYMPDGGKVSASNGVFTIRNANLPQVVGKLDLDIAGDASSVTQLASYEPIDAMARTGMTPDEFSGEVSGHVAADIPLIGDVDTKDLGFLVSLDYTDLALTKPIEGQLVSEASGNITVDPDKAVVKAKAKLNGAPAEIDMVEPIGDAGPKRSRSVEMVLDDEAREELAPGIAALVQGPVSVKFASGDGDSRKVEADLTDATLDIPWVGWSKGPGIAASASFTLTSGDKSSKLDNFKLRGKSFAIDGDIVLSNGSLSSAQFDSVKLNRDDDAAVTIARKGKGFNVNVTGDALDVRAIVKLLKADPGDAPSANGNRSISIDAKLGRLTGFHDEILSDVSLSYDASGTNINAFRFSGSTSSGAAVSLRDESQGGTRTMQMQSADAGAVLRFLDIYEHMAGGDIKFALSGPVGGMLTGQVETSNFELVNEPRLRSLVSTAPQGDGRSLNEAVKRDIDTSRVSFERGFAALAKGNGALELQNGVLRGPLIGSTFQGTLYDKAGNMSMTGTFMPAYGLNRIFGELPLLGIILGNGRDRGLIGVTFKLAGDADEPKLQINPLSVIAPGIFRSIFEFR